MYLIGFIAMLTPKPVKKARYVAQSVRDYMQSTDNGGADRGTQLLLALEWKRLADAGTVLPLRDVEFRNTSQNGEDGILLYLFTMANHGSRRAVEMCAGDAIENNSSNLVLHHDWDALMLDGDNKLLDQGRKFFARNQETFRIGPTIAHEWITVDNVNEILSRYGYDTDIDLFTIDMDGIDYWIADALHTQPRILVVEYNNRIPAPEAVTVPYEAGFTARGGAFAGDGFFGGSLAAFNKLLTGRNYRLVGANRPNTNAFFLREDVLPALSAVTVESCLQSRWHIHKRQQWIELRDRPWVRV
jgi:hypothetical protein